MNKSSFDGVWVHGKSGDEYRVLATSNTSASDERKKTDHPVTVFYQDLSGDIWSKVLGNFLKSFSRK